MKRNKWMSSLWLAWLFVPESVLSHHSAAIYDMSQQVTVEGTVTRVAWANPHVYVHMEQKTEAGELVAWAVEAYPPAAMRRIGWTDATLQAGDTITVVGNPTKRTQNRGLYPATIAVGRNTLFQSATMMTELSGAGSASGPAAGSIAGHWQTLVNLELIVAFYSGKMAVTEAGSAARATYDEASMLPALECIPYSSPLLMIDPDFKEIVVEENVITIRGGFAPADRVIHMDLATHDGASPSLQGHSIGRWEGTTLVIDTANFAPHRIGNGYRGTASGTWKHLVERLALQEGGRRLSYSFELTDPEFLAETVTGSVEWAYRPDLPFIREPCEPANAREFLNE